jgi:outer membrane receptor protein involved in Fe transport
MSRFLTAISFLCILMNGVALAAESPLEDEIALFKAEQEGQVVISAARYRQMVDNAPSSVTIITAREIQQYGWKTFADVFRSVRSFYVKDDRNYSYLGVRGFSRPGDFNSRILALLNGHILNDDIYQGFLLGREAGIDLDIVDRIEIVRGPGSALYGSSAFFAVVNIITKDARSLQGLRASAEVGSFNTTKAILTYGHRYENGLDLLLNASYTQSSGQTLFFPEIAALPPPPAPPPNNINSGFAVNSDGEYVYSFLGTAHYKDLHLQGFLADREKKVPTASYFTDFNDGREETFDGEYFYEIKYSPQLTQNLGLLLRAYDDWYRYKATYPYGIPVTLNHDYTPGRWYGGEFQINWQVLEQNRLVVGVEAQHHHVLLKNYNDNPYVVDLDAQEKFQVYSIYLQDEWRLLSNLALTIGVRYDIYQNYSSHDNRLTPRAALVYEPIEGSTIKLLYGQAFRVPNSYELFYCGSGTTFVCNPDLKPETINTYEGVLEQTLGPHLKGSLSLYRYDIKNLTNLTDIGSSTFEFFNLNHVQGNGIETGLRGKLGPGIEGYLSYAYQVTKNLDNQQELSNSPRRLGKAGLVLPLSPEGTSVGMEGQYVGERQTVQPGEKVGAYFIANLTFTFRNLYKNLEIQSSIYNLFNAKFDDPASVENAPILRIPQNGRNFNVKVTYRFF